MSTDPSTSWFRLAFSRPTIRRSLRYAVVVGVVLITINHGRAILRGDVKLERVLQMVLTVLVPYTVSTLSSVEAMRQSQIERARATAQPR